MIPVTTAVRPVLPPAPTPAVDFQHMNVTVEVPMKAPNTEPIESDNNAFSISLSSPFSLTNPMRLAIEIKVPVVSKKSKNKIEKTAIGVFGLENSSPKPEKQSPIMLVSNLNETIWLGARRHPRNS